MMRLVFLSAFASLASVANAVQVVVSAGVELFDEVEMLQISHNMLRGASKIDTCTEEQRVPRTEWWKWKSRLTSVQGSSRQIPVNDTTVSQCLRSFASSGLEWLLAVDGWAQAAWGANSITVFNGTGASKNFVDANKGDFLADWRSMFERMADFGSNPLTADALERINQGMAEPPEHQAPHASCVSSYDPFMPVASATAIAKHCRRPHTLLEDQLRHIDPELYDVKGARREPSSSTFRRQKLAEYLNLYNQEIDRLPNDAHGDRLQALARLAWNYAWLHPFCDGNGRTRTLIMQRELCRLGYHPAINFDNNFELFFQTPDMLQKQLIESMYLWEDAKAFNCIPWTPARAESHRAAFGAKTVGMPEDCSAENAHKLTGGDI
jgi:hypothetical protein